MTADIHRVLMTIAGVAAGLGGLMAGTDASPLGLPPELGAWMAFVAGAATVLATAIRANWSSNP